MSYMSQANHLKNKIFYKLIDLLITMIGDGDEKIQNYIYDYFKENVKSEIFFKRINDLINEEI